MKFDFCIGNPPYQELKEDGNKEFAPPIYDKFLDAAYSVADTVEMIHPARFLFNAGSTPKAWNEKMLNDPHIKVLGYHEDSTQVFSNTDIKGGIAITYRDKSENFGKIGTFLAYPEMGSVLEKIYEKSKGNLSEIVYTQNRFNLNEVYSDYPNLKKVIGSDGKDKRFRNNIFEKIPLFHEEKIKDGIPVLGVVKNRRVLRFIPRKYVDLNHENLSRWKAIIPRANGSGVFGETLAPSVIGAPNMGYTQTFIGLGSFDTKEEAEAVVKYLKTKFSRAMLGILKVTQDNDREAWRKVPLQDFTPYSDIDWSKSIKEIDQQLYKKYGLTDEEINFIETHVKEME